MNIIQIYLQDVNFCYHKSVATIILRSDNLNDEIYKSYDELPLMLSVSEVAKVLGVSRTSAYELVRSKGFPSITIGSRIVIPKEEFISWMKNQIK
jgi:excisionase family DNA binding protein